MVEKRYIVGNWKMNHNRAEIESFFNTLSFTPSARLESWVAPQAIHFTLVQQLAAQKWPSLKVGIQNCSQKVSGALTGEISPTSLKNLGGHFVILGHSERRTLFGECDQLLNEKCRLALAEQLTVIFCVGETLGEREAGREKSVVEQQLREGLKAIPATQNLLIAYEPVWAIGTGKTATPAQAEEMHAFIATQLEQQGLGQQTPILYGGSVTPTNIAELLQMAHIHGALVGGASLKGDSYSCLCSAVNNQ